MTVDYVNNPNQRTPCVLILDASYSMSTKTSSGKTRIHTFEYIAPVNAMEEVLKHKLDPSMAFPSKDELIKQRDNISTEHLPPSIDKELYSRNLKMALDNEIEYLSYLDKLNNRFRKDKTIDFPIDMFHQVEEYHQEKEAV